MGDVKLTWNGTDIVDISASGSKKLKTGGKYNPYDIDLVYTKPSGGALKMGVIRPDAELVQSYSYNKLIVTEDGITLPSYPSSSVTLKASGDLSPTITLDMDTYKYFVLARCLVIPIYNTSTPVKGRQEIYLGSIGYELSEIPPNTLIAASGTKYGTRITDICAISAVQKLLAWTNGTTLQVNNGTGYGAVCAFVTPALSSGVLTLKSPTFQIRSNTNYLPSAVYSTVTDIRYQWIIDVYRVAKTSLNIEGWTHNSQVQHIVDCWDNGGTLT